MRLGHAALAKLVPHAGSMCLLEAVLDWDDGHIVCESAQHALADHPLAADGRLPAVAGIELAAQAMAVHSALVGRDARVSAGEGAGAGWLARLRDCVLERDRLDDVPGPLQVTAHRLAASADALSYRFEVHGGGMRLLHGVILVALAPASVRPSASVGA